MNEQQIEQLTKTIENSNNGLDILYILISLIVLGAPFFLWIGKIIMRKIVDQVVNDTVEPQINLMKDLLEVREKETETFLGIMNMHIEELRYVTKELRIHEEQIDDNKKEIKSIKNQLKN